MLQQRWNAKPALHALLNRGEMKLKRTQVLRRRMRVLLLSVLCTLTTEASANQFRLWIGYELPSDPDRIYDARHLEADSLSRRNIELQACAKGNNEDACERSAEIAFRRNIMAIPGARFSLYYDRGSSNEGPGVTVRRLTDFSESEAIDEDLDLRFSHIKHSSLSVLLGVKIDIAACQLVRMRDETAISYHEEAFARRVCEMIRNDNPAAYFSRGDAKLRKGELEGAIADYDRALELEPKNSYVYWSRGIAKHDKGDLEGSIADYDRAIEIYPKEGDFYFSRGIAKEDKGDSEGAMSDYDRAIEIQPKHGELYNRRGNLKWKKDLEGAMSDYDRAIELNPTGAAAYCNRGSIKELKKDLEGAMSDYDRAIELNPKLASAYEHRGNVKRDKGDLEGAIADYDHAIELDPKFAHAYHNRAYTKRVKGDLKGATADFKRAVELDPKIVK